jgi:hypothetical protein
MNFRNVSMQDNMNIDYQRGGIALLPFVVILLFVTAGVRFL